jgi:hypothetical protein
MPQSSQLGWLAGLRAWFECLEMPMHVVCVLFAVEIHAFGAWVIGAYACVCSVCARGYMRVVEGSVNTAAPHAVANPIPLLAQQVAAQCAIWFGTGSLFGGSFIQTALHAVTHISHGHAWWRSSRRMAMSHDLRNG